MVGYSVRFDHQTSDATRIKYMTDGMLLHEATFDCLLSNYAVIVLDEVHERTLASDLLLGLLQSTLKQRPDLRLVIMSATLEVPPVRC